MLVTDALNVAVDMYRQGQVIDLEKLCRRILAAAPNHPDALNLMALALLGTCHFTEAVGYAAQAVALQPESLIYRNSLAMAQAASGDSATAEEEYRRLLALQPGVTGLRLGLAGCLIDQGSVLAAERVLADLPANLSPGELAAASLAYERIGWGAKALALARAAHQAAPQALETRLRLAEALTRVGAFDETQALLETCLADERLCYAVRLDFAALLHRSGFNALALHLLQKMAAARPDDTGILSYFGALLLDEGHLAAAEAVLRKSLKLRPNQGPVIFNHALALHKLGYPEAAIESYRRALAIDENCEDARINLLALLLETGERGVWSDLTNAPRPEGDRRQIYVLCFPKSGSTFLCTILQQLTGLRLAIATQGYFQNEQELSRDMMLKLAMQDYIVHQHCRATVPNVHLLQAFGIRPVILVRDLADSLVSMADFLTKDPCGGAFFGPIFRRWPLETRIDAVIARYAHWYIEFFASWTREYRKGALDCCFVRYEEMIADKPGSVMRVAQFLGVPIGLDEARQAVSDSDNAPARTLFNKGTAGRGRTTLSLTQQQELEGLTRFYPDIDFRPIGLAAHPD